MEKYKQFDGKKTLSESYGSWLFYKTENIINIIYRCIDILFCHNFSHLFSGGFSHS